MKRNKHLNTNLNSKELTKLKKINKTYFNDLPLSVFSRILINEALSKYKVIK